MRRERAQPVVRRPRKATDKPPMPEFLEPIAAKAKARHVKRHANPGIAVEVEKTSEYGYRLASPHADHDAWVAMLSDALGTRSESTAKMFAYHLTQLCTQIRAGDDETGNGGEWVPDELELNMILNMVASIKPKNEMQAALAAQMVAIHLLTMKAAKMALEGWAVMDPRTAATAGKLARTFVMQMDAMGRAKGKRSTRQTIKVSHEKHIHSHRHVHVEQGAGDFGGQPHEAGRSDSNTREGGSARQPAERPALPGPEQGATVLRLPGNEGEAGLSSARRTQPRRAAGTGQR